LIWSSDNLPVRMLAGPLLVFFRVFDIFRSSAS
jgi:hypothetical protein